MARIAKVFQSGNSQAVRLPKEFRFESSKVEIFRRGDEVVLREKRRNLAELPDDMIEASRAWTICRPRNARACDGVALPARYQHLHHHQT